MLKVTCKDKAEIHEKNYASWMYFMYEGRTGSCGTVKLQTDASVGMGILQKSEYRCTDLIDMWCFPNYTFTSL